MDYSDIGDFLDEIPETERKIYELLFEIKGFKDKERLTLYSVKQQLRQLRSSNVNINRLQIDELSSLKNSAFDKITKYNYIMEQLLEIVDDME